MPTPVVLKDNSTMAKRALVIFPESARIDEVERFRTQFDPQARLIAAHVTLVFPFESGLSGDAVHAHASTVLGAWTPFSLALDQVRGSGEYIFLDVGQGRADLVALHDQLYTGLLAQHRSSEQAYEPHLTLGRVSNASARSAAVAATRALAPAISAVVRSVAVFRVESDHRGVIESVVPLDAPAPVTLGSASPGA
jgi:2'-5' RNA ligase